MVQSFIYSLFNRFGYEVIKNLLQPSTPEYKIKLQRAYFNACKNFDKDFGKEYGYSDENFLARQEDFEKFLNSFDFNKFIISSDQITGVGFNNTIVPADIIDNFIGLFFIEADKDAELSNRLAHIRTDEKLNLIIEKISKTEPRGLPTQKHLNQIPFIDIKDVIGRENNLEEVKAKLNSDNSLVLVNGIGGIGKTVLAKAFIQKFIDQYDHIAWLTVSSSLKDTLLADKLLLHNLSLTAEVEKLITVKQHDEAFKIIINKLSSAGKNNLLVLDNAEIKDEPEIAIVKSLILSKWKLLLTSREQIADCKKYFLDVLSPVRAKELFQTHFKRKADEKDLNELMEMIGYHTLTIELLGKTAHLDSTLTIRKLIDSLKEKKLDSKKLAIKIKTPHAGEKEIEVYTHLLSIFDLTKLDENEKHLFLQLSVLPPRDIEQKMLFLLFNTKEEEQNNFINQLTAMVNKGYLTESNCNYKVHQMVQEIAWYKLNPSLSIFQALIKTVNNLLYVDDTKDNPVDKFPFVDFGSSLIKNLDRPDLIDKTQADLLNIFNIFRSNLGLRYQDLGRFEEAAELLKKALKSDIKNFGENHPNIARRQSNLALVHQDLGRYEEAAELLEKALKCAIKNFGENHPIVAIRQSNLGTVYRDLGRYEEAIELLKKALKSDIKNFGENHPNVIIRQSNLGALHHELNRYEEAAELFEKVLKSDIKNLGENHPTVALKQSNLAIVYKDLGRYKEAVELLEKALKIDIKNFGENHPNVASNQSNLAVIFKALEKNEEATELLEKALKSDIKNFGENHPNVAIRQSNLAILYKDLGRYDEAISLLEKSYNTFLKALGANHPKTKTVKGNLQFVHEEMNKKQK